MQFETTFEFQAAQVPLYYCHQTLTLCEGAGGARLIMVRKVWPRMQLTGSIVTHIIHALLS